MEYKEILIKKNITHLNGEANILSVFNNFFTEQEAQLKLNNNNIYLFLKEIDIEKVKYFINSHKNVLKESDIANKLLVSIESIKSYGLNNGKRNYVDYNKERKVGNRKQKVQNRGIYYYAQNNDFSRKNNEIPKEFENKIICGDSLKVLKKIPDNCIDLVFTSPPYNFGLEYSDNPDDKKWKKYFEQLFEIFDETIRILKYGGRIIVNVQPLFSDYIPSHHIISNYFMQRKMIWKGEILWEKNNYNCKYTAWGSWKSPSSPYLKYTWEFLEIFSKGDLKHNGENKNIDISAEEFKKFVVAKWSIAPERDMKKYGHPAMFSEKLVEQALKLFSFKNDIILDPFNGVGTTTTVAKRLNRRYLGIDISDKYSDIAIERTNSAIIENKLL
ncbi:MAG: DNA methylase [Bacteroidetes bacterium CG_4_8_14_3_um_filter_31_14]|nr:MAG: DNA methylase [Bacteroidetes bacterium CG_4_8_14_3_um_filter_31_14]